MRSKDNGKVEICVSNLVNVIQGEVPFARTMGLNRNYIGKVSGLEKAKMTVETKRMINHFEDRAEITSVDLKGLLEQGAFKILVEVE